MLTRPPRQLLPGPYAEPLSDATCLREALRRRQGTPPEDFFNILLEKNPGHSHSTGIVQRNGHIHAASVHPHKVDRLACVIDREKRRGKVEQKEGRKEGRKEGKRRKVIRQDQDDQWNDRL
jgi:hypothetical protein